MNDKIKQLQKRVKELEKIEKEYNQIVKKNFSYRYHVLFQSIPNLIFVIDKHGYFVDYKAPNTEELVISAEKIIGTNIDELPLSVKDLRKIKSAIKSCIEKNRTNEIEYSLPGNKGETRYFQAIIAKVNSNEVISIITDITDKKEIDIARKQSEIKYRTLFENTNDAVLILKHDRILDCNKRTLEMFMTDEETMLDKSPVYFSPEYQPNGKKSALLALNYIKKAEKGYPQMFEWLHHRSNGDVFLAEVCLNSFNLGNETFINASLRDISFRKEHEIQIINKDKELKQLNEKLIIQNNEYRTLNEEYLSMNEELNSINNNLKEALEKVRENETLFRTLVDNSPIGIMLTDTSGNILNVNRSCIKIFGAKSVNDFKSLNILENEIFLKTSLCSELIKCIKNKKPINNEEKFITPWNKKVCLRYSFSPLFNKNERLTSVLINIVDVSKRRIAEDELRKSKQLYSSTINSITEFIHVVNKSLKIKLINDQFITLNKTLNLETDVIGKHIKKVYPFLSDSVLKEYDMVFQNKKEIINEDIININGKIIFTETKKTPIIENGKVSLVITSMRDITEIKRKENELIESEKKYRLLADNHLDIIWLRDLNLNSIYVSPSVNEVFGYTPEEYKKLKLSDLYVEDSYKKLMDLYNSDINKLKNKSLNIDSYHHTAELQIRRKDKRIIWVETNISLTTNENKEVINIFGVTRDITKRKITEISLKESEEKFRKIFETSPDSITINEMDKYLFTQVNQGFEKITGYKREQVLTDTFTMDNLWKNKHESTNFIDIIQRKGYVTNFEAEFIHANGSVIYAMLSATIIKIKDKPHILAITKDISERKKTEIELLKAKEKAIEADRLKTAFLANMSHEIRTPMNAIVGFSNLLTKKNLTDQKKNMYINQINKNSDNLLHLINDIIDLAKIESGQMNLDITLCNIKELFNETQNYYKEFIQNFPDKKLKLSYYIDSEELSNYYIYSDPYRLKQVLNNLINNAIKFTNEGYIRFSAKISDNEILICVSDTGIGLTKEKQEVIFDRFRQVEEAQSRKHGGTGLGLTIAKNIISIMGGKIWVESEPEKGSTFYFTIPYNKPDKVDIKQLQINNHTYLYKWNNKTLLIAEDDDMNYLFLEEILADTGIDIIRVTNGLEAVETIKNKKIDLLLMDLQMPELDGFEATKQIRNIKPDLPIIAQTAYALDKEKEKCFDCGCNDYLTKPIIPEDLLKLLNKHITINKF